MRSVDTFDKAIMRIKFKGFLNKNSREILAAFVLAYTLLFFAPISVFINNAENLNYKLEDIWYLFFLTSLIAFIILSVVIILFKSAFSLIAVLFCALSIGFIIQGNWIKYNLGVLDGHEIIWDSFNKQLYLELILWILVIGIFLYFRHFLYKNLISIFLVLVIFQVSNNVITVISNPLPDNNKSNYYDTSKEFEFAKSNNVIIIVLDTFRSEAFDQILIKYPEYKEVLKDFIFYQDALGGYPTTLPSVPLALTGEYYDNSIPISKFIIETQENTVSSLLKKNGFAVENYSIVPFYDSIYDNSISYMPFVYRESLAYKQYIVSGIRYLPLVLKKYFVNQYYQGLDYYHKNMVDFAKRVNETKISDLPPTFKLFHFSGAHPPFQLDNDLNNVDKGYIEQAAASLKIVKDLILELKITGGYDNSLIIIIGDHGSEQPWEYKGTTSLAYSAQPLMLAKRVNQHFEEIQISDAKVSLSDIPKSIAEEMGIANSYSGYSIFGPIPGNRSRKWFYYEWSHSSWSKSYIPDMYEFEIFGPANQFSSYKLIKKLSLGSAFDIPYYQLGDNIINTIIADEVFRKLQSYNFSYEKNNSQAWSWASGPEACISLPIEPINRKLTLSITSEPFIVVGQLEDQKMNIMVDQIPLIVINKNDVREITISSDQAKLITQDEMIDICFGFPDANKSPKDYGISNDTRLLGYSFTSILLK